jgi:glycosyltransferase involved in cell wall biosynthesis
MKVLIIHNSYQQPGGEDVVFEQERRMLESRGHQVVAYRRSNWEVHSQSLASRLTIAPNLIWSPEARWDVAKRVQEHKPDLVHIHNTFLMISPSIFSVLEELGLPVVQTLHNYRLFCPAATFFRDGHVCEECVQKSLWRSVLHGCYRDSRAATSVVALMLATHRRLKTWSRSNQTYIALTEFSRQKFIRAGLVKDRLFVKPNFVHPDPGVGPASREYALFVGRLSPEKRVSTVLAAWQRLRQRIPLLIVGGGPERAELEADAKRQDISGIYFEGPLPRTHTITAIQKARILLFSSEWYENFPVTIAEAFACGTPVIASRLGAMREIIDEGRTGLLFQPGNPDDLAEKVAWAWNRPDDLEEIGRGARLEYEAKYTEEKNYEQLMRIYETAMSWRAAETSPDPQGYAHQISSSRSQA